MQVYDACTKKSSILLPQNLKINNFILEYTEFFLHFGCTNIIFAKCIKVWYIENINPALNGEGSMGFILSFAPFVLSILHIYGRDITKTSTF